MDKKIAVLASGTGSLLEAMIKVDKLPISLVFADRSCRAINEVAKDSVIYSVLMPRASYGSGVNFDRERFTRETTECFMRHGIGIIVMAGFMTVFSPFIFASYRGRILNTHPSLLPSFKGDHAVRDTLAFGAKVTGCTIHIATEELDAGPILAQQAVAVREGDTEATLHERIKKVERKLYPATIREFAAHL